MSKTDQFTISKQSEEISLKEMIIKAREWRNYFISKWILISIVILIGAGLGLVYSILSKPVYIAQLSFALEDDKQSSGGSLGLASQLGLDLGGGGGGIFAGDNLLELMKSRSMIEKSFLSSVDIDGKQQTLVELYIKFKQLRKQWANNSQLKNISFPVNADQSKFTLKQDSVLGIFYSDIVTNNLSVSKIDKKLSIITIGVSSENELFSKYFAECIAKTVSDFYINTKTKKSSQNVNILQHQADSVRAQLNAALTNVASSVDVNPNPNPMLQRLKVPSQRRQVDVQANTAILNQLVTNLELAKVTLRKETPLIQIIDSPILPLDKKRLSKLKGIVVGGLVAGLFSIIFLAVKKMMSFLKTI